MQTVVNIGGREVCGLHAISVVKPNIPELRVILENFQLLKPSDEVAELLREKQIVPDLKDLGLYKAQVHKLSSALLHCMRGSSSFIESPAWGRNIIVSLGVHGYF